MHYAFSIAGAAQVIQTLGEERSTHRKALQTRDCLNCNLWDPEGRGIQRFPEGSSGISSPLELPCVSNFGRECSNFEEACKQKPHAKSSPSRAPCWGVLEMSIRPAAISLSLSLSPYMYTHIRASMHPCIHASIHPYIHTSYMHTSIPTYIHTYIHPCMHTCRHTCMQAGRQAGIHAYMHTCIHAHRQTDRQTGRHTCMHAYIHMCTLGSEPKHLKSKP